MPFKRQWHMPKWKTAVLPPIEVEVGEADLRLQTGRDLYPIVLAGKEYTAEYDPTHFYQFGVKHSGIRRSLNADLLAVVRREEGVEYPGDVERVTVGSASAEYFIEDRALFLRSDNDPHDRPEDEQVELAALFEQFARTHCSDATKVYRFETPQTTESVLHRLGYHLAFTVRRRPDGRRVDYPPRVWAR